MEKLNIADILKNNSYPGRGIILGKHQDEKTAVIAYFIMGRSENSRNRVFVEADNGIKTRAFDESKLVDPSLVIYAPVRVIYNKTIVTNGDQTDTVYDFVKDGKSFEDALRTRTFEPDPPILTPRISGMIEKNDNDFSYKMSILKSAYGNENAPLRYFWEYEKPLAGQGHFIHTYMGDGNPVPSFEGEPKLITIDEDINSFTNTLWNSLNEDNKVSLFVRYIDIATGEVSDKIMNKLA